MRNVLMLWLVLGVGAFVAACGKGGEDDFIACDQNGQCPAGYSCIKADNRCVFVGFDGGPTADARQPDSNACGASTETTITNGPTTPTSSTTATFTFSSTPGGCSFQCSIDNGAFMACSSTFSTTVGIGTHTLRVKAGDDPTPAELTWLVDTTPPETTATCPATTINVNEVSIVIGSNEAMSTLRCKLDGEAEADCSTPFRRSNLAQGAHTFSVYAVDKAGNKDASPATCNFTVSGVSPNTTAVCPASFVSSGNVSIAIGTDPAVAGATFGCKLNGASEPCSAPSKSYSNLAPGTYDFEVVATADGKADPTPATCKFTVDPKAPDVHIITPANGANVSSTVTVTFEIDDDAATLVCKHGGTTVPCLPDHSFTVKNLAMGDVTFSVEATDKAGNKDSDSVTVHVVGGPAVEITFAPYNGAVVWKEGTASFELLDKSFTMVRYVCKTTFGGQVTTVDPCTSPLAWSGLKDKDPVKVEVTAFDISSGQPGVAGPTVVKAAVVDARGPGVEITSPQEGWVGPDVTLEFIAVAPLELGPVTYLCKGPQGQFPCMPGTPVNLTLKDGSYSFEVIATDQFKNEGRDIVAFNVDATGPSIHVTHVPDGEVCPSSSDVGEFITFEMSTDASDGPVEDNPPVEFTCTLFKGAVTSEMVVDGPVNCTVDSNTGAYKWTNLDDGPYTLLVIGFDRFENPGPNNPDVPGRKGILIPFVVDKDPPQPFEISILNAITRTGSPVTSGDSDVNVGNRYLIQVTATETSHPPPVIVAISIDGVACNDSGIPCKLEAGSPTGTTSRTWRYSFKGLADGSHTVSVSAQDACGAVNRQTKTLTWTVDAVANDISFQSFDPVFVAKDPAGPENDVTSGTNTVHFTLFDDDTAGFPNETRTVDCAFEPGGPDACAVDPDAGPGPAVTVVYQAPFEGFDDGINTFTVSAVDEVGNPSEETLTWCVDDSPPTLEFTDSTPQVNSCTTTGGVVVALPSGVVNFELTPNAPPCAQPGLDTATCTLTRTDGQSPGVVAFYDHVDCTDGTFEFGTNAGHTALADGAYRLDISAHDAVNSGDATLTRSFVVDGTAPTVVFDYPGTEANHTYPLIIPRTEFSTGSLHSGGDVALTAPAATYALDPSGQNLTGSLTVVGTYAANTPINLTYPITALADGAHTVSVKLTDCAGHDSAPASLDFKVDFAPPTVDIVAEAEVVNSGSAVLDVTAQDSVTNVNAVRCIFDTPNGTPTDACPGLGGLPHEGTTAYTGKITLTQLAPGRHIVRYLAVDFWGHASDVKELEFTVTYRDDETATPGQDHGGHVVLVGHDFGSPDDCPPVSPKLPQGTSPDPCQQAIRNLAGNLVALTPVGKFGTSRVIKVLVLNTAKANANGAVDRLKTAITARLSAGYGLQVSFTNLTDPSLLDASLLTMDALLLPDQNDAAVAAAIATPAWFTSLSFFARHGGIVGAFDGLDGSGEPSNNFTLVDDARLMNIASAQDDSSANYPGGGAYGHAEKVCDTENPLAKDVGDVYVEPYNTVRFLHLDPGVEDVFMSYHSCEIAGRAGQCTLGDASMRGVVLDKPLPARTKSGPVRIFAFDAAGARRDQLSRAVYSDPKGDLIAECPLFRDGTSQHVMPAGGIATVATDTGNTEKLVRERRLESVFDVEPSDLLIVGYTKPAPGALDGGVSVTLPEYDGADHYFVTDGCNSSSQIVPNDGPPQTFLNVDRRCLLDPTGKPRVNLIAVAQDVDGKPLAYATGFAACLTVSNPAGCDPMANDDWQDVDPALDVYDPWAAANAVQVDVPAAELAAVPNLDERYLLDFVPYLGAEGLVYDEEYQDLTTRWMWFPTAANAFADSSRTAAYLWFAELVASESSYSVLEEERDLSTSVTIHPSEFLPRVFDLKIAASQDGVARPVVSFESDEVPTSVDDADIAAATFTFDVDATCSGFQLGSPSWTSTFTPRNPDGAAPAHERLMPKLPDTGSYTCLRPAGNLAQQAALGVYDDAQPNITTRILREIGYSGYLIADMAGAVNGGFFSLTRTPLDTRNLGRKLRATTAFVFTLCPGKICDGQFKR